MKTQTVQFVTPPGSNRPELETTEGLEIADRGYGHRLYLGTQEPGAWEQRLALDRRNPPHIHNGRVLQAVVVSIQKDGRELKLLARPYRDNDKLLVRFSTRANAGSLPGSLAVLGGTVRRLAFGWGPNHLWVDELWEIAPLTEVHVTASGTGEKFVFRYASDLRVDCGRYHPPLPRTTEPNVIVPLTRKNGGHVSRYQLKKMMQRQQAC